MKEGWKCTSCLRVYNPEIDYCTCLKESEEDSEALEDELGFIHSRQAIELYIDTLNSLPLPKRSIVWKYCG